MKTKPIMLAAATWLALLTPALSAQGNRSIGLGGVLPQRDYADVVDTGFSVRFQSLALYDRSQVQLQGGWSRFSGREEPGTETESADVFHVSLGIRLGATVFVGANGGYFWGDTDDGLGFFPEAGVRFGRIGLIADYRVDGDENWLGLRAELTF